MRYFHSQPEVTNGKDQQGFFHRLDLIVDGEKIGQAEMFYKNAPFPFYYLSWIDIVAHRRGRGYGKTLLTAINRFLDSKGRSGLLRNVIFAEDPTSSIYQKNGWRQISGREGWYIYNPPNNLIPERLNKALYENEQMMD